MVFFHVQRLSGGFALSLLVGVVGTIIYGVKVSIGPAFTFLAYLILISTYLNVLGEQQLPSNAKIWGRNILLTI